jgi:uncharacterized protein (DUF2225 family)
MSIFKTLKPSAFVENKFAIDMKPVSFKILVRGFETLTPRHYKLAKCIECYWAADLATFEEPVSGSNISSKVFKNALLAARDSVHDANSLNILSRGISTNDSVSYTLLEVLKIHLLACKNLSMIPGLKEKEPYNLARFALRTAWVLEDVKDTNDSTLIQETQELFNRLGKGWYDLPNDIASFRDWAYKLYELSLVASRLIQTPRDEVELILLLARLEISQGKFVDAKKRIHYAKSRVKESESSIAAEYNKLISINEDEATKLRASEMAEIRRMKIACDELEKEHEILVDHHTEQEFNRALGLLSGLADKDKTEQKIKHLLLEAGVVEDIITSILKSGKSEKKSLFNWLSK